ncbi:RNA 2',3'-cyclic phosphodiesterase [uncultured Adlercreutzia sp.]|uniref:RNA 2',3'-cyclic phosphodiesterase n=1 Tax=uncultured Adlercreutzia sp. TaxID=875803 RepID=UPI0025ED357D|nr:RNA 2',3'-cyclic phosphodiesterase [uncultured Adlercreutzia sp.]MCI9262514.1 RNA 2',3'-cyclic phosphodiesterase [Eggerthellaceae bacterium]
MRTFIALDLPTEFADGSAALARMLGTSVEGRFLPRDTYHLTLAFLGDIEDAEAARAMDAIDEACDKLRESEEPVLLAPDGLGKFGRPHDATLWLGIAKLPPLETLAATLKEALRARALPFDDKPFLPHVTLARRARLPKGDLPSLAFPLPTKTETLTLYKSTLDRDGATYKPLYQQTLDD